MQTSASGLALFEKIVRVDPLFAAEGLDIDNAHLALDALEQWTNACEEIWKNYSFKYRLFLMRYPLREALYPVAFLRAFLESERARRTFITVPTQAHAANLLALHRRTATALKNDTVRFRAAHCAALELEGEKLESNSIFHFFDSALTFGDLLKTIDVLEENADALSQEIERRARILAGEGAGETLSATIEPISASKEGSELSADLAFLRDLEERQIRRHMDVDDIYGPYSYTTNAYDAEPTEHRFSVYLGRMKRGAYRYTALRIVAEDVRFFLDLQPSSYNMHLDKTLFGPLIERGVPYWHQGATNFYCIRDVSFYADLATLADRERRPFLDERAVLSQKSSLLDYLLWCGAYNTELNILQSNMLARAGKLASLIYLFVARSHSSLFYLPFNKSVWRLPQRLSFPGGRFNYEGSPYLPFDKIAASVDHATLEKIFEAPAIRRKAWEETLAS